MSVYSSAASFAGTGLNGTSQQESLIATLSGVVAEVEVIYLLSDSVDTATVLLAPLDTPQQIASKVSAAFRGSQKDPNFEMYCMDALRNASNSPLIFVNALVEELVCCQRMSLVSVESIDITVNMRT